MLSSDTCESGLMVLSGEEPLWIWAFTCPTPACDCRTAIVISTKGDRETLLTLGAPVREAWLRGLTIGSIDVQAIDIA
jgi:hypothetical protein